MQLACADHAIVKPVDWKTPPVTTPSAVKLTLSVHCAVAQFMATGTSGLKLFTVKVNKPLVKRICDPPGALKFAEAAAPFVKGLPGEEPVAEELPSGLSMSKKFRALTIEPGKFVKAAG